MVFNFVTDGLIHNLRWGNYICFKLGFQIQYDTDTCFFEKNFFLKQNGGVIGPFHKNHEKLDQVKMEQIRYALKTSIKNSYCKIDGNIKISISKKTFFERVKI